MKTAYPHTHKVIKPLSLGCAQLPLDFQASEFGAGKVLNIVQQPAQCYNGDVQIRTLTLYCGNTPSEKILKYETADNGSFNKRVLYYDQNGKSVLIDLCGSLQGFSFRLDTLNYAVQHILVKGGRVFNAYTYGQGGVTGDKEIVAPLNSSGIPSDVSHIGFVLVERKALVVTFEFDGPCVPECLEDLELEIELSDPPPCATIKLFELLDNDGSTLVYSCPSSDLNYKFQSRTNCNFPELNGWVLMINNQTVCFNQQKAFILDAVSPQVNVLLYYCSSHCSQ